MVVWRFVSIIYSKLPCIYEIPISQTRKRSYEMSKNAFKRKICLSMKEILKMELHMELEASPIPRIFIVQEGTLSPIMQVIGKKGLNM